MLLLGPTPRGGLLFFHVTAACSFLSISLVAVVDMDVAHARFCSRGVGGGCNNTPDDFKTVGHTGLCNLLPFLISCIVAYAQQGVVCGGVGGGCNNVPDNFKTVGHKSPYNLLLLLTCCTCSRMLNRVVVGAQ